MSVRAEKDQSRAIIKLQTLRLPLNGAIKFYSETSMLLMEASTPSQSRKNVWLDRGKHQFDFNCAANWLLQGSNDNPNFRIPCAGDTAIFPNV